MRSKSIVTYSHPTRWGASTICAFPDQAFDGIQYQRLSELTNELMKRYPSITQERITGHSEIAPGRKTDPGPLFNWEEFRRSLDLI